MPAYRQKPVEHQGETFDGTPGSAGQLVAWCRARQVPAEWARGRLTIHGGTTVVPPQATVVADPSRGLVVLTPAELAAAYEAV